jgi:hypothetical protein
MTTMTPPATTSTASSRCKSGSRIANATIARMMSKTVLM